MCFAVVETHVAPYRKDNSIADYEGGEVNGNCSNLLGVTWASPHPPPVSHRHTHTPTTTTRLTGQIQLGAILSVHAGYQVGWAVR